MKLKSPFLVEPHVRVRLSHFDPSAHQGCADKEAAEALLEPLQKRTAQLQQRLFAGRQKAVLIVLQGMDASGKDGAVRHIFSGLNPQGCKVTSFKQPTELEAAHDFLWRCHAQVPARGTIGIFNRSHYEDVLVPRVHGGLRRPAAQQRLVEINDFERMLTSNGTVVLKFFLHISRKEQQDRFAARKDDPEKRWKLDPADLRERRFWQKYTRAYEDALSSSSTAHAPWFVVPADHKWFRNLVISQVLVETLEGLRLRYRNAA